MLEAFVDQNYLIIESNVVTNIVVWNGDTTQWTPPQGSIALVQATTPALIWQPVIPLTTPITFSLQEQLGAGSVGFTWDGTVLTTNLPKPIPPALPEIPADQPATSGTQTA